MKLDLMCKADVESTALAAPDAEKKLDGKTPKWVIVVPGKIVNIVIGSPVTINNKTHRRCVFFL